MSEQQVNNPLHGVTWSKSLTVLVEHYGWDQLGILIDIRCFNNDPSVKSSLKFSAKNALGKEESRALIHRHTK